VEFLTLILILVGRAMTAIRSTNGALCRPLWFAAFSLILTAVSPAMAQNEKDRAACFSLNSEDYKRPEFWDKGLAACTKIIASKKFSGRQLAFYIRAKAAWMHKKGDLDGALREIRPRNRARSQSRRRLRLPRRRLAGKRQLRARHCEYSQAIRIDPTYAAAYYSRGLVYEKLGKLDRAKEDYNARHQHAERSLRIPPPCRAGRTGRRARS